MRRVYGVLAAMIVVAMVSAMGYSAQDGSDSKPEKESKLTLPWRKLDSLTNEQRQQINEIHKRARADIRAIEQREQDEIFAVLTDEQKAEIQKMQEEKNAQRRAREAERKSKKAPQQESDPSIEAAPTSQPT